MLLTDKNLIVLTIDNINIDIVLNFKTLENIYHFLKDEYLKEVFSIKSNSPFEFLEELEGDNLLNNISTIIFCMCDGELSMQQIKKALLSFKENEFLEVVNLIKITLINQLIFIDNDKKSENKAKDNKDTDSIKKFEEYFNYFYTVAKINLNLAVDEFYKLTPAKLKEMIKINNDFKKNIILSSIYDVLSDVFSNSDSKKKENVIIAKDANAFFDAI